jgi:hypothetical protein
MAGKILTQEKPKNSEKTMSLYHFVRHNSHTDWREVEHGPPRCEACYWPLEPRQGLLQTTIILNYVWVLRLAPTLPPSSAANIEFPTARYNCDSRPTDEIQFLSVLTFLLRQKPNNTGAVGWGMTYANNHDTDEWTASETLIGFECRWRQVTDLGNQFQLELEF